MFCSLRNKILSLVTSGLILATIGLVMFTTFPIIMDKEIKKRLVLEEGTESYKMWKDVPVPIYIKFYFFNVTNPEEVYDLKKPVLEELGPYTFREEREKVNITWNANGTVSYRQVKRWYFQPDKTVGSLSDLITTLNVPMIAAATQVQQMNQPFIRLVLEKFFDEYDIVWLVNKTVEEFLFEGYEDELISWAQPIIDLPYDKFGWFYKRNDTDDGEFVVDTGAYNIESVDKVFTWNNQEDVSSYSPPCNMINGSEGVRAFSDKIGGSEDIIPTIRVHYAVSDITSRKNKWVHQSCCVEAGDMWPPGLTEEDKPTIFITDICRSLSFTYLKKVKTDGITAYRYWADDTQLDNGKYNAEHLCFCSDDICLPAGAVNVSSCKFDAPAVVSYPHFLFADPSYSQGVIGMHPNPQDHRMYIDLIPEMGIPLGVAARMQINVVFQKLDFAQFQNITRRTYFPMFWFSETAEAGQDIIDKLKLPLVTVPLVATVISFVLIAIGGFLVFTAFVLAILYALGKIQDKKKGVDISKEVNSEKMENKIQDQNTRVSNATLMGDSNENNEEVEREPAYAAVSSGNSK